jgi:exonuclease VII small subunit
MESPTYEIEEENERLKKIIKSLEKIIQDLENKLKILENWDDGK